MKAVIITIIICLASCTSTTYRVHGLRGFESKFGVGQPCKRSAEGAKFAQTTIEAIAQVMGRQSSKLKKATYSCIVARPARWWRSNQCYAGGGMKYQHPNWPFRPEAYIVWSSETGRAKGVPLKECWTKLPKLEPRDYRPTMVHELVHVAMFWWAPDEKQWNPQTGVHTEAFNRIERLTIKRLRDVGVLD